MTMKSMLTAGALATTLATSLVAAQSSSNASTSTAHEYVKTASGVLHGRNTGNPNTRGLAYWPRYDTSNQRILKLAPAGSSVMNNFDEEQHCSFWEAHPQSVKR
jgi:carboxylesterase type B